MIGIPTVPITSPTNTCSFVRKLTKTYPCERSKKFPPISRGFSRFTDKAAHGALTLCKKTHPIACDADEPGVVIEETVTAGNSSLGYNATTGQYTYIWKTERSWKGTCRKLVVRLNDNTNHLAKFRFR